MFPKIIQSLINFFDKFPEIGKRQAERLVFYLLTFSKKDLEVFATNLLNLKDSVGVCYNCSNIAEREKGIQKILCKICRDKKRDGSKILLVEKVSEITKFEELRSYNGTYHLLGELEPEDFFNKNNPYIKKLIRRIEELKSKNKKAKPNEIEVIIALNPTKEGDLKTEYLKEILKKYKIKVTRLGRGIPTGGLMEYADKQTLEESLLRRKSL